MLIGMTAVRALVVVAMMVVLTLLTAKAMETVIGILVACTVGDQGDRDCQCPWAWLRSICTMVHRQRPAIRTAAAIRQPLP